MRIIDAVLLVLGFLLAWRLYVGAASAVRRRAERRRAHAARPRPLAALLMGYGLSEGGMIQNYVLGFPTVSLTPGERRDLTAVPQVPFRPRRLIFTEETAPDFRVEALRIRGADAFAVSSLPALIFSELSCPMELELDTASQEVPVTLSVLCVPRPEGPALFWLTLTRKLRALTPRSLYWRYRAWRQQRRDRAALAALASRRAAYRATHPDEDLDDEDLDDVLGYPEEDEDEGKP